MMTNNQRYQRNMKLIGKALLYLDEADLQGTDLAIPYKKLSDAHYAWLQSRKEAVRKNWKTVKDLYDTQQYAPDEIADKLKMNPLDVADVIGKQFLLDDDSVPSAFKDDDNDPF